MKKIALIITCLFVTIVTNSTFSQVEEKKMSKIQKEVRMEDENGKKVLTIITTTNGVKSEEVFEGKAAEIKLTELQGKMQFNEEREEIKIEDVNGKKKLTILTTKDGEVTEEVFTGTDAEKKMKEKGILESNMKKVEKE